MYTIIQRGLEMSTLFFNFFQKILAKARRRRLYHSGNDLSILF